MQSKWSYLKPGAIRLRKLGKSLPYVHKKLGIPKSTLSYWFKDIELTKKQKERLHQNWKNALVTARKEAAKWHRAQKAQRLETARTEALRTLERLNISDNDTLEIALALLYLGEGSKKKVETALGSSDPKTLLFYVTALERLYGVQRDTLRCQLYLRADQDADKLKRYWSRTLHMPLSCFRYVHHDTRTVGRKTYADYNGVCSIAGAPVAIQRKLVYLAHGFLDTIIENQMSG
ncbi:hypothetical protein CL655_00880 [bacterium]|nr:hypothetical protein [bacterium]|tara:strand:- start:3431 stop:4129 length:699 start_codon:yes stop_codon:yes gene_type:complete